MGWFDTNTNEESNVSAFRKSVSIHYNSDITNPNNALFNEIAVEPDEIELSYDRANISGNNIELRL